MAEPTNDSYEALLAMSDALESKSISVLGTVAAIPSLLAMALNQLECDEGKKAVMLGAVVHQIHSLCLDMDNEDDDN